MIQGNLQKDTEPTVQETPPASEKRQLTFADIQIITNKLVRVVGEGRFAKVYHGNLKGSQVAVKMLSPSSVEGYQQLQLEASNHDTNLVTT